MRTRLQSQWWRSAPAHVALLFLAYAIVSLFIDDRGTLGTDTGAKIATLEVMKQAHTWIPGVGYWAEASDPAGLFHPLYGAVEIDGRWIEVTTLPMLLLAYPLYVLGGMSFALLLPILGGCLAAAAARRLAIDLKSSGTVAFWLVGLATPVAIYSQDFWEHSLGLAAMAWGLVALIKAATHVSAPRVSWSLAAGALFGLAASMRTEALVYGAVSIVVFVVPILRARRFRASVRLVLPFGLGVVALIAGNVLLELAVLGGSLRVGRGSDALQDSGLELGVRAQEAVAMLFDPSSSGALIAVLLGGLLVVVGIVVVRRASPGSETLTLARRFGAVAAFAFVAVAVLRGLGFVSGLFPTTPTAVAAFRGPVRGMRFHLLAVAIAAMPLVWLTDYVGGVGPQWGGRYILLSGFLFAVCGVPALLAMDRVIAIGLCVLGLIVTCTGVAWLGVRAQAIEHLAQTVFTDDPPAYLATNPFLLREFGQRYRPENRWLSLDLNRDYPAAASVFAENGITRFGLLAAHDATPVDIPGWNIVTVRSQPNLGSIDVTVYAKASP